MYARRVHIIIDHFMQYSQRLCCYFSKAILCAFSRVLDFHECPPTRNRISEPFLSSRLFTHILNLVSAFIHTYYFYIVSLYIFIIYNIFSIYTYQHIMNTPIGMKFQGFSRFLSFSQISSY